MAAVMIGVDPHKASHTAVVISAAEEELGGLRVRACAGREAAGFPGGHPDGRAVPAHDRDRRGLGGEVAVAFPAPAAGPRVGEPRPLELAQHVGIGAEPVKEGEVILGECPQANWAAGRVWGHGRRYRRPVMPAQHPRPRQ